MPINVNGTAIVRPDLGQLAWEYALDGASRGFVGSAVMPFFPTPKASGVYPYIPSASLMRLVETERAARSGYSRIDWAFGEKDFFTKRHGLEAPIDDYERALYQSQYAEMGVEQINTLIVTDHLLRGHEKRVVDLVTDTANLSNAAATVKWDVVDTADPRADVEKGIELIEGTTGLSPNVLVMSKKLFRAVRKCKAFVDHVKYIKAVLTESMEANLSLMADYLQVDRILLASEIYNSSKDPKKFTPTTIWPDSKVLLAKLGEQPMNLKEPCLGRTFLWDVWGSQMLRTESYREEQTESDIYRVKGDFAEQFVFKGCGYIITGAK